MKIRLSHKIARCDRGFTLLEALLLVSVLAVGGVGIGSALRSVAHAPGQNDSSLAVETALVDKMEYLHSLPFDTLAADLLNTPSSFSDTVTINGTSVPRTVSIVYITPATGVVSGIPTMVLQVSVSSDVRSLVTLVNKP